MKRYKEGKYSIREYDDGYKEWFLNGLLHREDGPAVEDGDDGIKMWFLNGKIVYSDDNDYTNEFDLTNEMKRSIVLYKLRE